jgi:hypothetical protein
MASWAGRLAIEMGSEKIIFVRSNIKNELYSRMNDRSMVDSWRWCLPMGLRVVRVSRLGFLFLYSVVGSLISRIV